MLDQLVKDLQSNVNSCGAELEVREVGDSVIFIQPEKILEVCRYLKSGPSSFNVLEVITGRDAGDHIEVSYIVASYPQGEEAILKVKLPRENPEVTSVCSVWLAANFQERECFDMLGVKFTGHPDLRRILCPDDWEGFPLRKDYVAAKTYRNMEIYPESKMNLQDREFAAKQKAQEKAAKEASA